MPAPKHSPKSSARTIWLRAFWRLSLLVVLALGLGGFYSTDWGRAFGSAASGSELDRMQRSPRYSNGAFVNSVPTPMMTGSTWTMFERYLFESAERVPHEMPGISDVDPQLFGQSPDSRLRLTWLGHSTVLIEIDGQRVLSDPVFSERASPSPWVGPRRFFPPPLPLAQVPTLDAVLISHDHYDHLDYKAIVALAPVTQKFFVPLGVAAHLKGWGVPSEQIVELDWFESATYAGLEFTATPARHFSGRSLGDRNHTLWASWVIVGNHHRVFFSGDTGYFGAFKDIKERFGPFDVAMLEAGAYDKLWANVHLGPENVIRAYHDLGAKVLLPIHWGTYNLALHAWTEPIERLRRLAGHTKVRLAQPQPGESFEPEGTLPASLWWR